jgi:lipopolysaccharide/colanic/teichoic acid biosynthesis glycosyltransferase/energy-coupling factor transporter ATP-binding protein EcfA2
MTDEPSRVRKLTTVGIVVLLSAGVPAAAVSRIAALHRDTPVTIVAIVLYETLLAAMSFILAVSADLRSRWVSRVSDAIDSWLRRKVSRFTRAYLRYVEALTKYMDTRGLSTAGPHILEMVDVQVTLSLAAKPLHSLTPDPVRHHIGPDASSDGNIWYWLNEAQRKRAILSVIGPPGSGKSTLLRHVAFTLAKDGRRSGVKGAPNKIPILINLREQKFSQSLSPFNLADILRRALVTLDHPEPPSWVEVNLRRGKFAILLDGLDEIADQAARIALTEWLTHQVSAPDGNLFVLTSRPFGYRDNPISSAMVVEVQPLAEEQISSFVNQWYQAISARSHAADNASSRLAAKTGAADLLARLDQTPSLFELTANPLLLTMLVNVHYYRAGALPGTRAELYDEICDVFLGKRDQVRSVRVDIPGPQKRAGLQVLAYEMMCRGITEVKADDASSWIDQPLSKMARSMDPLEFLRNIEDSAGLLLEKERGIFSFAHLTFQEYLTAEFIRETGRINEIVGQVSSPWWRETLRLYASISDATPVVNECLKYRADPDMIVLGAQCTDEANALDKETRRAIDECINPPSARDDVVARHTAARAQLQLRASKDISLKKSSFIGGMHVTWLEYQYFIDSTIETECLVPDHWHSRIYPAGADRDPVVGIRYTDAAKFCDWLDSELQSMFRTRLASSSEIERALELSGQTRGLGGLAYWTTTQLPHSRDGRFWPLLRNPSEGARRDTYPLLDRGITRHGLDKQIAADLLRLSPDVPADFTLQSGPLSELTDRCWAESSACDVGQMQKDIQLAESLVRHYVETDSLAGEAGKIQIRLMTLASHLCSTSVATFDRRLYSDRASNQMIESRESARRTSLEAAVICMDLHVEHGGDASLPALEKAIRPSRKVPNPSRLPTVAMNILAHAFMGTYIDFSVVSARISRRAEPAESLIYVREARDIDRSEVGNIIGGPEDDKRPRFIRMLLIKRLVDIVFSTAILITLSPLLLALGLAIRFSDDGPALFTQTRIGKDGQPFRIYKFRTMVTDAEARLAELMSVNESDGVLFKLRRDPRVTRLGARLRRWSIDELPQLINVLRGDMSLVGPRPALPDEAARYSDHVRRKLVVKPGLTGLWQINGRSDLSWNESIRLDLRYVDNWSLALDLQIMWKTIPTFIRGTGRY